VKLYGITEIAEYLGKRPGTVAQWYRRGKLPEPKEILAMGPVWDASDIERWHQRSENSASPAAKT
jgi:predicted DNA-binding transcriptional regulator AlpA